ncbi:Nudix family hydrolase [Caldichromatium japonicum]|uniref:8-oxo-dGTP diphosphatase n=1 Tax=Caldichromatium japonicum TaxID=2699430 RepID=A0A6G7VEZ8_9GAMM|nr:Nudix family hydrolase [Caldichromatium japonicum]QIK38367.1 Nudix family hydrolase [Caldichromatium japonicum]
MSLNPGDWLHVVAGVLSDEQGRVLIARRAEHLHQGGLWEFPGGKLKTGESPQEGLARELAEELGIALGACEPLIRVPHDYGDRRVLLDVYRVLDYQGIPRGCEGQALTWLVPDDMDPTVFPAADRPVIAALRLPRLMLITGPDPTDPLLFRARLQRALAQGVRLVQLRAPELVALDYRELTGMVWPLCQAHGAHLLLNRAPKEVEGLARDGLHLNRRLLMTLERRPGSARELIGASCHTRAELRRAVELGLDYALLSPVKPTASHPEAQPLGWPTFAELIAPIPLPVYALGGLTPEDLDTAIAQGAQGIAAIRGLWPA